MEKRGGALVTGASRGLGRALTLELARGGYGVTAAMRDPSKGRELMDLGVNLKGSIDIQLLEMANIGEFAIDSGLEILVNNAAFRVSNLPVEETSPTEWRSVFDVNFFGLVEITRRVVPILRSNGGGVICNIGSSATFMPRPFNSVYVASKAAVSAFSDSLALELAPFNIRVLEIVPGPIDTDMLRRSTAFRGPEAARFAPYQPMAERCRGASDHFTVTEPRIAASAIVDVIEGIDSTVRHSCDAVGAARMAVWRHSTDLDRMKSARQLYDANPDSK